MAKRDGAPPTPATLTRRERQIVSALLDGRTNKEIAGGFGVSEQTVKNQLRTLYAKLGVKGRLQLAMYAMKHRLNDAD